MEFITSLSPLTLAFSAIILGLSAYFHGPVYSLRTVNTAPSILTSLGIFGTFLGIALGLMDFDVHDVEGSVPQLIQGLKTAFWSSIAGLLGAMSIKMRHVLNHVRGLDGSNQVTGATMDDLATLLGDIRMLLGNAGLQNLEHHLRNSDQRLEASLHYLANSVGSFQSQMADSTSHAIISALENLLHDFNEQINLQYGDNFYHLNQAVGQMLKWQDAYKEELEHLLNEQRANGDLLNQATEAYATMVQHTEIFNEVAANLGEVMQNLQERSSSLGEYLSSMANLVNQAGGGLPKLENRVLALTDGLAEQLAKHQQQMHHLLSNGSNQIIGSLEQLNDTLGPRLKEQLELQEQIALRSLSRGEQQLIRLDAALEKELTHSLETFGSQLAALSEKFVSDYTPLTDKLRQLVQLSAQLEVPTRATRHQANQQPIHAQQSREQEQQEQRIKAQKAVAKDTDDLADINEAESPLADTSTDKPADTLSDMTTATKSD